jgi:hypothetical protein
VVYRKASISEKTKVSIHVNNYTMGLDKRYEAYNKEVDKHLKVGLFSGKAKPDEVYIKHHYCPVNFDCTGITT